MNLKKAQFSKKVWLKSWLKLIKIQISGLNKWQKQCKALKANSQNRYNNYWRKILQNIELKNSVSQIETTGESLANRMNKMENQISTLEDKVQELVL